MRQDNSNCFYFIFLKEEDLVKINYLYDLKSRLFINNKDSFKSIPLPAEAQFSSIEDFSVSSKDSLEVIYVGNKRYYVSELGSPNSNPGVNYLNMIVFQIVLKSLNF